MLCSHYMKQAKLLTDQKAGHSAQRLFWEVGTPSDSELQLCSFTKVHQDCSTLCLVAPRQAQT